MTHETAERVTRYRQRLDELLSAPLRSVSELLQTRQEHDRQGVYTIARPDTDEIVYVGRTKTKGIAGRVSDHRSIDTTSDLRGMLRQNPQLPQQTDAYRVRYVVVQDPRDRLFFEYFAIACLAPTLNK